MSADPATKHAESYRKFTCLTCAEQPEFDKPGLLSYHLQSVHNLKAEPGKPGIEGARTMRMGLDGAGYSHNVWEWEFAGGIKVQEVWHQERVGGRRR